jgi:hypothetical protein
MCKKIISKIKNWYHGKPIVIPTPGVMGGPIVYPMQPPLARFLKIIGQFWLKHWQFIITTSLVIIGLYIAWKKL